MKRKFNKRIFHRQRNHSFLEIHGINGIIAIDTNEIKKTQSE